MTHYKSTLATAFVALGGLVVAQQVLYPRVDEEPRPRAVVAQTAEVASAPSMTWVDPPAKPQAQGAGAVEAKAADPKLADAQSATAEAAAPAQTVPVPPTRHVALSTDGAKKAEAAKRRKLAQTVARNRQMASRTMPPAEAAPETAARTEPAPKPRIDPIGDIIRGLGIGGQG